MFCDDGTRAYAGGVSVLGWEGLRGEIVLGLYEGSREKAARAVALRAIRFPGLTARANLCRPCGAGFWVSVKGGLTRSVRNGAIEERSSSPKALLWMTAKNGLGDRTAIRRGSGTCKATPFA